MRLKLAVWTGLGLYALLSATDWMMTFALLRAHPGAVEANPLAAECLAKYGWNGLAVYKAVGVAIFIGAILFVTNRRPAVAALVTASGCAVLLTVTIYSHGLLLEASADARESAADAADAAWPKPKPGTNADPTPRVPDRCWFAPDAPATTATAQK